MKKRITSRITAFILALAMLAALVPTMPVQSAAAADGDASAPYTQTIETNADKVGSQIATDAKLDTHGWEINKEETSEGIYNNLANPDSSGLPRFFKMYYYNQGPNGKPLSYMSSYFYWGGEENKTISFKFYNAVAGTYDINAITYEYPGSTVVGDVFVNGEKAGIITCDATENAYTEMNKMLAGEVYLKEGENILTITKTGGGNGFNLAKLILTPFGADEVPEQPEIPENLAPTGKKTTLNFKVADYLTAKTGYGNTKVKVMGDVTANMGGWTLSYALTDSTIYNCITNLQASSKVFTWYQIDVNGTRVRLVDNWCANPDNKTIGFDFEAPAAGYYGVKATLSSVLHSEGTGIEVIAKDGNGYTYSAGTIDETTVAGSEIILGNVYLTEGANSLVLKGAKGKQSIVTLDNFVFAELEELKNEVVFVPESSAALVGETVGYKAWVNMIDGSMLEAEDMTGENSLTVTSSDTDVAIIENGKIKAIKEGTTELKVTAVVDGTTYEKTAEFSVIAIPEGEFKLVADAAWPVKLGRRAQILVQGAYSNVVVNMENATDINVKSDEEKATATTVYKNGSLYVEVKGVSEGETEVTLSAKYNGKSAEVVIPITVDSEAVEGAQFSYDLTSCTWQNLKLLTHGIGVNEKLTAPEIMLRQGWVVYLGHSAKMELKKDESVYMDVNIPSDGEYVFSMNSVNNVIGFVAAFYMDGEFIGEYDFSDLGENPPASRDESVERSGVLRNVKLTAGTHTLQIKRVSDTGTFLWIKSFTFAPVAASPTVVGIGTTSSKNTFTPGESIKNEFSVRLSDGRDFHIPAIVKEQGKLTVTNRMPERMDYADGIMKAKKTGVALFQADADVPVDGGEISGVWTADISEGQLADFTVATGSSKPVSTGVYEKGWAVNEDETTVATSGAGYVLNANGFNAVFNDGEVLALDTFVQNSGIYNVDAAIAKLADGAVADVYIGEKYLGRIDFANSSESVQLNTVELNTGIDTIYIKKVGGGGKIALKQLSFVRVESMPEYSHTTIENEISEIALKKTLQVQVKVMMKDGRQYHIGPKLDGSVDNDNKIEYSDDPTGVFSVDANTGLMTGNAVGEATLKAKVTVKGVNVANVEKEFSVVHVLKIFTADPVIKVLRTETSAVELSATMDDEPIDITQASEINPIPGDYRTEGEVVIKDGKALLHVTGLRGGETTIDVEAVYNGVVGRVTIPVTVSIPSNDDDKIVLDFMPSNTNRPSTPQAADIYTHGWEVNETETSAYSLVTPVYKLGGYGLQTQVKSGEQFAFDFWASKSGNYTVDMTGTKVGPSGIFAALYIDGVYLGEFDFAHPTSMSDNDVIANQNKRLNSVSLSAGRHTVVIKKLAKSRPYAYDQAFWLGTLKFISIDGDLAFDYVEAKAGKNLLCVGESTDFCANAYMTDGNIRYMADDGDENNKITITNSNPAVAEIRDGRIHALSIGETTFTVSAKVDGLEKIAVVDIEVDDAVLDSIEAVLGGDLSVGQSANLSIKALAGEREIDLTSAQLTVTPVDGTVVSVSGTKLTGLKVGTTDVTVTVKLGDSEPVDATVSVNVVSDGLASFNVNCASKIRPQTGTQISVTGGSFLGEPIDLTDAQITYYTDDTDIVSVDANGYVTGLEIGEATIKVTVKKGIFEGEQEIKITVTNGKVGRSYYTDEKVANALENASKYVWARNEKNNAVSSADFYVDKGDLLWNMVTTHTLPRAASVGYRYDPYAGYCRYCNADLTAYGSSAMYAWEYDAFNSPWKMQCPACRRRFPTNDFGSFYKLGIDENGEWDYELSHSEHYKLFQAEYASKGVETLEEYQQMRASGKRLPGVGYLKNNSATDVANVATVNNGRGLQGDETVEAWGVDDGFGYKPGYTYATPSFGDFEEAHTYIALYNRFVFAGVFNGALSSLSKAYMYTNEMKYARAGALLLDRIADVYPDMYWSEHFPKFSASDGSYPKGRIEGRIWETSTVKWFAHAYDAFYPAFDDPQVVSYLSDKAAKYNMENSKKTGDDIRKNIEDGVLREIYKAVVDGDIHGNFGMHQARIADVGVILDSMPESREILDYLMAKDTAWTNDYNHTGGDVMDKLINGIDRDGGSEEGITPNYSMIWYNCISDIAEVINGYKGYEAADLFKHPKVQKMLENLTHFVQLRKTSAAIGDSGVTAGIELCLPSTTSLMRGFRATNNVLLAQTLYFLNGNTTEGLHEDIFTKNPDGIRKDIEDIIDEYGEYPFDGSLMLAEQGYAILRDGSLYSEGTLQEKDSQRAFWMNFGFNNAHTHPAMLNLGIDAFGLDFAPDLGYPTNADGGDEYINWGHATVNHNTVVVDDSKQRLHFIEGFPMHFDDAGRVKIMDVDASVAYDQTDIYRRTVIMVEANDDISYGVDFFRVRGGTEHLYSFHSQSNTVSSTGGFTTEEQIKGTYAGESVPYRTPGVTSGYSYFTNVRKAENPGVKDFYVDYLVEDFRNLKKGNNQGLHMRVTMLNDFEIDEISLVKGETPVRGNNPRWLEYMLARRSSKDGQALDTTFTTVLEPYKESDKYIDSMTQVEAVVADDSASAGTAEDVVRAIKVTLTSGREDYIVYASNSDVKYLVDGKFTFQGFAGVCSYVDGEVVYSYLSDGVEFTDITSELGINMQKEYTGEVVDFTRELVFDNFITVKIDGNPDIDTLKEQVVGRWMYVENSLGKNNGNAAYLIKDINVGEAEGTYDISLGNTTLIRSGTNVTLEGGDFVYNIAPRQWFNIPMSQAKSTAPIFAGESNAANAVAGKKFTKTVTATSPADRKITYTGTSLPRGASVDSETGTITWTPDSNQVGEHHIAICADDGVLETTLHFDVTVYKATGSADSTSTPSTDTGSSDSGAGSGSGSGSGGGGGASGGGGAGGGGSSSGGGMSSGDTTDTGNASGGTGTGGTTGGDVSGDVPSERFIDLGNHTWAKDAIYSLVDKGVVNGTSHNTYSPGNNIKRADFAIMLVRAFGITEGEGGNFADVDAGKYYAEELRLAKANGIVNGIGENKFNPEGEITRQDMMLMLTRALDAVGYELSEADWSVLAQFSDAASISDYAADAVARVVRDGIIAGANGRINPLAKATRAEVAVMFDRVLSEK